MSGFLDFVKTWQSVGIMATSVATLTAVVWGASRYAFVYEVRISELEESMQSLSNLITQDQNIRQFERFDKLRCHILPDGSYDDLRTTGDKSRHQLLYKQLSLKEEPCD
jgi:hypothetical protein